MKAKPISLSGIPLDEAVSDLLKVKPPDRTPKKAGKRKTQTKKK